MHKCPNGKVYIGLTSMEPRKRWLSGTGYKGQPFYNAIAKYGWDNIEHIIIADNLTKEEACNLEIETIKKYKSRDKKYGYNISVGGDKGNLGQKFTEEHKEKIRNSLIGRKYSPETIEKMRQAKLGKKPSDETRKKYSEMRKGCGNPRYGVHLSEETKNKISLSQKGRKLSEEQKEFESYYFSKPVVCVETGIVYSSQKEAGEKLGIDPTYICNVLAGRQKTTKNLHFEFLYKDGSHRASEFESRAKDESV